MLGLRLMAKKELDAYTEAGSGNKKGEWGVIYKKGNDVMDILKGENKNIEYKQDVPDDHVKFIKTAVAFANGVGGQLVFGIADGSLEVKGINRDEIFEKQDAITNAIYDSCEPKIMPDASVHEIDGKSVIVVDIPTGMQTPYYIKSMGMQEGCFIRVSGTTQHTDKASFQELILKGTNRSFDQVPSDETVTEEEADALCDRLYEHAKAVAERIGRKESVRRVNISQLLTWKLLLKKQDGLHPTNGFYLLDGRNDKFPYAVVQCGAFKGITRTNFLDRKEFDGPIDMQLEDAYAFLLRHLNMGTTIKGLGRDDKYELPTETIRELLANAFCSRSYLAEKKIQVMLYSDRLEITSPGRLDEDLTVDELRTGVSKIRNKALAMAFSYMFLVEAWGTGIPRMYEEAEAYGLREPEILAMDNSFRVNLYRSGASEKPSEKPSEKTSEKILELLQKRPEITIAEMAAELGRSDRAIEMQLSNLKAKDLIYRDGPDNGGKWRIKG